MKIIGFEEHYGLPAIYDAAIKANDPYGLVLEALKKAGHFPVPADPKVGFPAGIYDLGEGRIAAMDDAGIDVQILSYATPSAERLEPSHIEGANQRGERHPGGCGLQAPGPVPRICHTAAARPYGCSARARAHRARPGLRGRHDKWQHQWAFS